MNDHCFLFFSLLSLSLYKFDPLSFLFFLLLFSILFPSSLLWPSLIGNFLSFFFCFLFDWKFSFSSFLLPRIRIMVSQDFGSRFVEWLDMIHVRVWFGSMIKRDAPHYFHDTNAKMMIWKFYAKLVMHAPMRTLKCQIFMVM